MTAGKLRPQGDTWQGSELWRRLTQEFNNCRLECKERLGGVQSSRPSMLSGSYPPLMDPVMDTVSEEFKDGQAAHLLKQSFNTSRSSGKLRQSMTFLLQANDLRVNGEYLLLFSVVHMHGTQWKVIKSAFWPFVMFWQLSAVYSTQFFNECGVFSCWYLPVRCTESTESNGERCVVMHSPVRLLWGLSRKKKKSTEELQEWKMLVCQFVTKAVCSCVIDWQTVLAHYP